MRAVAIVAALVLAGCVFPVQGAFVGRALPDGPDRQRTIVIIYNHGFSGDTAGTYQPRLPPILEAAERRNGDVVVFAQLRNTSRLESVHHANYIESAVEYFEKTHGVPRAHLILAGQSCGGWGSLQAAAFKYPDVGGVVAFAPTCHGRLPHSTDTRLRRLGEIARLANRLHFPGVVFLYEGDSYYDPDDWMAFIAAASRRPGLRVERLSRETVLKVCSTCGRDSHGAVWDATFGSQYFESHLQPLIERVRATIRHSEGD